VLVKRPRTALGDLQDLSQNRPMTTAAPVEFRVLGPLEIVGGGSAVPLTADKLRLLLAALLIRAGEALPADALIDALWEGTPPASARKALHIYVSQLRGLLPAGVRIETRGSTYVLVLNSVTVDAHRFESLFGRARTALADGNPALARSLFTRALSLWRGPAYAELAYADVARAEADRLEELRLAAEAGRLEAQLDLGEGDVVASARKLVAEHPHDERVARLAMLALYRADRQAEALEEYAAARARLDTLGLEPGRELRELQRAILVHEPSLQPTVLRSAQPPPLPAAPNALVGRERELAELADLLAREDVRFVVLTGAGGVARHGSRSRPRVTRRPRSPTGQLSSRLRPCETQLSWCPR
jgi:DNA-binding SARP family transcriptional activator